MKPLFYSAWQYAQLKYTHPSCLVAKDSWVAWLWLLKYKEILVCEVFRNACMVHLRCWGLGMNSLLPQLLRILLTDSLLVLTPMWLLPLEKSPSSWPPVTCQHGYILLTTQTLISNDVGMASWSYFPFFRITLLPLPSMNLHLKRTPPPFYLIFFEESESWGSQATTALERGRLIQFTTSVFGIPRVQILAVLMTKQLCCDHTHKKKVHLKTHLDGKHPLGSLGTLKETYRSLFWTPWHFGTPDIPLLADYLWISWSPKIRTNHNLAKTPLSVTRIAQPAIAHNSSVLRPCEKRDSPTSWSTNRQYAPTIISRSMLSSRDIILNRQGLCSHSASI